MGAFALLLGGIWSARKLPMDAIPDITGVQVQVNTTIPSLAPDEVENLVTFPLETALGGIAGVTEMRSLSRFGLSQITLQFTDNTDIYRARQLVAERLQGAADSIPPGLTPKLVPNTTGLGEVFYYSVDYEPGAPKAPPTREAQLMELWQIQEYVIKPQLRTVPGIAGDQRLRRLCETDCGATEDRQVARCRADGERPFARRGRERRECRRRHR